MGQVYDAFVKELEAWSRQYAGRPRELLRKLFLLALEREEMVSRAYRESVILARLNAMPLEPAARDLIHRALLWAWRDEEMHAVYIRGALMRLGNRRLRALANLRQLAGTVGGWSTSIRQHAPWRVAPLARTVATLITGAGYVGGQIPRGVWAHLRYRPFRDFCLFNIDAEMTAWLCWDQIDKLAAGQPDTPPQLLHDFRRIVQDEADHEKLFTLLADVLDETDRLRPGVTTEDLAARVAAIGRFFLPRGRRGLSDSDHPLGAGGDVHVMQGTAADDKRALFRRFLEQCGLAEQVQARAAGRSMADLRVVVKPTFMMGYSRKDRSPLTDPELLDELARFLHDRGCRDVAVVEGPNIYDWYYQGRSVPEVARYLGIASPYFRVVDSGAEQVPHTYHRGMAQYTVGRTWKEADVRISFGKMRSHPIELAALSLSNLEWLGARCDQFVFAERQAQRETAVMMLVDEFPPHFALLDAYEHVPDGLVGVMGGARPRAPRRFYGGADALAVDTVALRHLGVRRPTESSLLRAAYHWFDDPEPRIRVVGPDTVIAGWRGPIHDEVSAFLSFLAWPMYVHGSGRGALFVPEMDERAFPPIRRPSALLRLGRKLVQRLLGLRLKR